MDPITLLSALLPVAADGIKALIGKFTGNKPTILSADDYSKVNEADIKKLEAIAKLDIPTGTTSVWVSDVRAMQRPVVVMVVLIAWFYGVSSGMADNRFELVSNLASAVMFYLFGERAMMHLKRNSSK